MVVAPCGEMLKLLPRLVLEQPDLSVWTVKAGVCV